MPPLEAWKIIWSFWPFIAVEIVLLIAAAIARPYLEEWARKKVRLHSDLWVSDVDFLQWLRGMDPAEFEDYISKLFFKMGYRSEVVGGESDGGIDVVLAKDGVRYYVQCKRYRGNSVSASDMREFYGALNHYGPNSKGFFVTTTNFSEQAIAFAEGKPITLINGSRLVDYVRRAEKITAEKPADQSA